MRESFGGTFMIQLLLIFIVIYVSFMAVALNYAKAFRIKNGVINYLEQYQFDGSSNHDVVTNLIPNYLNQIPYNYASNTDLKESCMKFSNDTKSKKGNISKTINSIKNKGGIVGNKINDDPIFIENGVCIVPLGNEVHGRYYKVITYIPIDFNFFSLHFHISISGETKVISTY